MPGRERQRAKTSEQSPPDSVSGIRRCLLPKTAPVPLLLLTESNPLRLGFDSGIRRLGDRGVASRLPVPISAWGRRCTPLTLAPFRQKAGCFLTRKREKGRSGFSAGSPPRPGFNAGPGTAKSQNVGAKSTGFRFRHQALPSAENCTGSLAPSIRIKPAEAGL